MNYDNDEQLSHPIIQQHRKLLEKISNDDRTCAILYTEGYGFSIDECCDYYFGHKLTKSECLELSELFREIAEEIE